MAYMLPLRFIKVSKEPTVVICATRITAMMSTKTRQARKAIKDERDSGSLINATGKDASQTAIFLDNGVVVASPLSIPVLLNSIEKSNEKSQQLNPRRLRVYDVYDEEPNPDIDEAVNEISASYEDDDDDYEDDDDD